MEHTSPHFYEGLLYKLLLLFAGKLSSLLTQDSGDAEWAKKVGKIRIALHAIEEKSSTSQPVVRMSQALCPLDEFLENRFTPAAAYESRCASLPKV